MKVLVTGGAGYIGSVISAQLLGEGHDVVVLDNLSKGHADSVEAQQGATLIDATIDDADEVLDPSFDAVVHCAARSLVAESVAQPEAYWWNNVAGSLRLLDAMRAHGVSRIVFSSTAAVYGEPAETPIREEKIGRAHV